MSENKQSKPDLLTCLEGAMRGDRRLLARSITLVENGAEPVRQAISAMRPRRTAGPGAPHVIGLSGPPGSGKSSLVDRLVGQARARGRRVAVVAVDPASPFSGGAILGDRVRMDQHSADRGVFIRSLSSRGHLGGLSLATGAVVELLDLCGWDLILVETVGVGQSEIAVMEVADTVVVVLTPESGDTVQTMKAGLMEIADLFVVNKADRPGAGFIARDLEAEAELEAAAHPGWKVPVLTTSAVQDQGIEPLLNAIDAHLAWCVGEGRAGWDRRRAAGRLRTCLDLVAEHARHQARERLAGPERDLRERLLQGEIRPHAAAVLLREALFPGAAGRS